MKEDLKKGGFLISPSLIGMQNLLYYLSSTHNGALASWGMLNAKGQLLGLAPRDLSQWRSEQVVLARVGHSSRLKDSGVARGQSLLHSG